MSPATSRISSKCSLRPGGSWKPRPSCSNLEMNWEVPARSPTDLFVVEANGASPADQTVTVIAWLVRPGDEVRAGQRIAEVESDKSVLDLSSPVEGTVHSILVEEGEPVGIGTVLALIDVGRQGVVRRSPIREEPGVPRLARRAIPSRSSRIAGAAAIKDVRSGDVPGVLRNGIARFPEFGYCPIVPETDSRTRSRGDSASTAAIGLPRMNRCSRWPSRPPESALEHEGLSIEDIDLIVCSTNTPIFTVPSLACLILHALDGGRERGETAAYDLTAACTGYLYGLSAGYDFLSSRPAGRVMVVTAEAMSHITDPADYYTTTHFGDAASATILHGRESEPAPWARLEASGDRRQG